MYIFKCLFILLIVGCSQLSYRVIESAGYPEMAESRLGKSRYVLRHPSTMFLEEARGKEGQLGYGLWVIDSARRLTDMHAFVEIEHGKSIGFTENDESSIEVLKSFMLNKPAFWTVSQTETGFFNSFVKIEGLNFSASAPRRSALDSVIAILSTVERR